MTSALLSLLLAAQEPRIEALQVDNWHFAAFPIVSYGSDVGLLTGAALFLYKPLDPLGLDRDELTLSLSYATRGPRAADASWEVRRILDTSLRANLNVHLGDDELMPYWGEGAGLGGLPVPAGSGTPPPPYRYHDRRVFAAATLRSLFFGPLGWHVRARFLDVDVASPSPLLAASAPPGVRGGRVALAEVGLFLDTRDRDVGTRRGVFASAAGFAVPHVGGISDFAFHGFDAALRAWVPLLPFASLAFRGIYDVKRADGPDPGGPVGAVPFFERMLYEGITYGDGFGGASTLRGAALYRISGDEKALGNVVLDLRLVTLHPWEKTLELGLTGGLDAGWARQPGYAPVHAEGVATGVKAIWDKAIVIRIEGARTRGGENTIYLAFGDLF